MREMAERFSGLRSSSMRIGTWEAGAAKAAETEDGESGGGGGVGVGVLLEGETLDLVGSSCRGGGEEVVVVLL